MTAFVGQPGRLVQGEADHVTACGKLFQKGGSFSGRLSGWEPLRLTAHSARNLGPSTVVARGPLVASWQRCPNRDWEPEARQIGQATVRIRFSANPSSYRSVSLYELELYRTVPSSALSRGVPRASTIAFAAGLLGQHCLYTII
jgi:hypothetical protein